MEYQNESRERKAPINTLTVLCVVLIAIIILGAIVQVSWNYTLVDLAGVKQISLLQSIVLVILVHALFGGVCGANVYNFYK